MTWRGSLVCVCNDNTHCFQNKTLNSMFNLPMEIRFCIAPFRGFCYASPDKTHELPLYLQDSYWSAPKVDTYSASLEGFSQDVSFKYGCLHFSPFLFFMCSGHPLDRGTNTLLSCCNKNDTCNYYLRFRSPYTKTFDSITGNEKVHKQNRDLGKSSFEHMSLEAMPFMSDTPLGPELLMKSHSLLESDKHLTGPREQGITSPGLISVKRLPPYIPMIILAGVIFLLVIIRFVSFLLFSNYFHQKRKESERCSWVYCITSPKPKLVLNSSSVASTNSTNLQESQSLFSSQFIQNKTFYGKMVVHKLEFLTSFSRDRNSEILSAKYEDEVVSVRLLHPASPSRSLMLWKRLTCLHEKCVLRHSSLSGINAADVCLLADLRCRAMPHSTSEPTATSALCAFTISEFYPWGSLFNFMQQNSPTDSQYTSSALTFALCALIDVVNGITFLHSDMAGTRGRPALAHRNICLENLHLKVDGGICIGGLEYAICAPPSPLPLPAEQLMQIFNAHLRDWSAAQLPIYSDFHCSNVLSDGDHRAPIASVPLYPDWWPVCGLQVGLPTYMAPEIMEETLFPFCFESHKRADVYALGIMIWEIATWALGQSVGHFWVPRDADIPTAREMVCLKGQRPRLPILSEEINSLNPHQLTEATEWMRVSDFFRNLLPECWNRDPETRLSALRIKKDLTKLQMAQKGSEILLFR
uniref:receptor protein serine/threonine kinase n=2 Tax=Echinococcus granulosus TaxID=6210 RepID=A0A068WG59_ECHGR|nr:activin receptor type 1 [Echinococcus granulosus]